MSIDRFLIGLEMDVSYPNFQVSLTLLSVTQVRFEIKEGLFARTEIVDIQVVPLGNSIFAVSWQEKDGATVTHEPGLIVAEGDFVAIHGRIRGWADAPQVVMDVFRIEGSKLAEHWDVLQIEVPVTAALGGISMFDPESEMTRVVN